jgi:unsaturated rhamnogalacturonyl hydrolase
MSVTTVSPDRQRAGASELLVRLAERTRRYDFSVWFWGDAIAIDGLLEAAELSGEQASNDHCLRFYHRWLSSAPSWVDHLTPGVGLLRLYEQTGEAELLAGARRLAAWLTETVPHTAAGQPLYRPDLPPYRHTVWVDTLYHEPPFFAALARHTGEERWADVALDCWEVHARSLSRSDGPILGHSYDTGAGLLRGYGWGRGNGWALLGMVDTLEWLADDHPRRSTAVVWMRELAEAILSLQDVSGCWRTLLNDREAYLEVSTAAFFGAAFLKGARLGVLDERYTQAAETAWAAVCAHVDGEGSLWGVSACTYASTHPDDDVQMYKTLPTEVNVWGQGAGLRLAAERIRSGLG